MNDGSYQLIHEYMQEILYTRTADELRIITESYDAKLGVFFDGSADIADKLWQDAKNLGNVLVCLRDSSPVSAFSAKQSELSPEETAELAEAESIIRQNRLTYFFQPIVNASDGEIYSYEALMRAKSDMHLSPLKIIKYAEMSGRLNDIELATFMNVLSIIDTHSSLFTGRKIFINSIPNAKLSAGDYIRIDELLSRHSDDVVVEMTEQTESDEPNFREMNERYRRMNIKIAIDDYGTGYSNVRNLLRYAPDYVKIDRTLLSEIQNSPQKRHFVREIVEFCHDNGILALAEGVETEEELRCVILLGADLIQGYYTARPSAEIIGSIPNEIKQQIRLFSKERQDGVDQHIYAAEDSERILLDKLIKNDCKCILIGKENSSGDVTIVGSPALDTDIHIEVADNYKGRINIENARLSNVKGRPTIDLGENSSVVLVIRGENKLAKTGIRVPESAELTIEGDGVLRIILNNTEYFGIGNDLLSRHGTITLNPDSSITIESSGKKGVCIGSGRGGKINIIKGQYILDVTSDIAVGIGSFYDDCSLDIYNCDFSTEMSVSKGVAIGSLDNSADIHIHNSAAKLYMSGKELSGLGTVSGERSGICINDANVFISMQGDRCTAAGALNGSTVFSVENAAYRISASGDKMLVFGGFSHDTRVSFVNVDAAVKVETAIDFRDYVPEDNIRILSGRAKFMVNNYEVKLKCERE